ncbi:keratin, type I cytoskeletal 9, partial [Octopus bimaculoides]|uniref:keratin, type I cytoskeletal 9 n=1 Tax=Octopus bimaculoides TaxID=37653 RepID=UPI00071DEBE0
MVLPVMLMVVGTVVIKVVEVVAVLIALGCGDIGIGGCVGVSGVHGGGSTSGGGTGDNCVGASINGIGRGFNVSGIECSGGCCASGGDSFGRYSNGTCSDGYGSCTGGIEGSDTGIDCCITGINTCNGSSIGVSYGGISDSGDNGRCGVGITGLVCGGCCVS